MRYASSSIAASSAWRTMAAKARGAVSAHAAQPQAQARIAAVAAVTRRTPMVSALLARPSAAPTRLIPSTQWACCTVYVCSEHSSNTRTPQNSGFAPWHSGHSGQVPRACSRASPGRTRMICPDRPFALRRRHCNRTGASTRSRVSRRPLIKTLTDGAHRGEQCLQQATGTMCPVPVALRDTTGAGGGACGSSMRLICECAKRC